MFQSLSGLSLGLNLDGNIGELAESAIVSIPFRAVTGFEPDLQVFEERLAVGRFNPFQGCHWV